MKNYPIPFHSENKYIKGQSAALAEECLDFLGGERLGDLSIGFESNSTRRKVRRIMEKRICQDYWRTHDGTGGNGDRQRMRSHLTNHMKNIYGCVPEGFRYCA